MLLGRLRLIAGAAVLFGAAFVCVAQTITLTGPTLIHVGGSAIMSVSVSGTGTTGLTGVQFAWGSYVPGAPILIAYTSPLAPTTGSNAGLGLGFWCGSLSCLIVGYNGTAANNQPLADGVIGTFTINVPATTAPGTYALTFAGIMGVSITGVIVPIQSGPTLNLAVSNPCDINGDGVVNVVDVQTVITDATNGTAYTVQSVVQVITAMLGGGCKM